VERSESSWPWRAGGAAASPLRERRSVPTVALPGKILFLGGCCQGHSAEVVKIYVIFQDRSELFLANGVGVGGDSETGRPDWAAELRVQPLPAGTPHRIGTSTRPMLVGHRMECTFYTRMGKP
jgi:hypothetical protein